VAGEQSRQYSPSDAVAALTGNWWAPFASGVLAIVLGAGAIAWPTRTFEALVVLFGVYAFVGGAISLSFGLLAASARERWWPLVVNGIVGISVGVLSFAEPQAMAVALVSLVGGWGVLTGALEIVAAFRFRRVIANEFLLGLSGVLSIVFGVLLVAQPSLGAATFAVLFGAYAVVIGVVQIWLGSRLKGLRQSVEPIGKPAAAIGKVAP
jgi:uncharacterized membrane protein HdeD (DUF308 family)